MKFKCMNCGNVQLSDDGEKICSRCGDNVFVIEEKVCVVPVEKGPVVELPENKIVKKVSKKKSKK